MSGKVIKSSQQSMISQDKLLLYLGIMQFMRC